VRLELKSSSWFTNENEVQKFKKILDFVSKKKILNSKRFYFRQKNKIKSP